MAHIRRRLLQLSQGLSLLLPLILHTTLAAQTQPTAPPASQPSAEERIGILEEELEKLRLSRATHSYESVGGLGPAASSAYTSGEGLSWGGYGEVKYRNYRSNYRSDQTDLHRFILYAGYRFNDWIVLNSELEYEHAGFEEETVVTEVSTDSSGLVTSSESESIAASEVAVEFAYLDLHFADALQLQAGLNLVPFGIYNYRHEPTTFLPVERTRTETDLIPSTWREIGLLLHGNLGDLLYYRAGIVNGPRGSKFSDSTWIRSGRSKGSQARAEDFAWVGQLDLHLAEGFSLGAAYYSGEADQGELAAVDWKSNLYDPLAGLNDSTGLLAVANQIKGNLRKDARLRVQMAEGHLELDRGPWRGRALYTEGWLNEDGVRAVNNATNKNIGKRVWGAYGEIGFNVLSLFASEQKLYPYLRYERLNTQWQTVQRYPGGEEDQLDLLCATALGGSCPGNTRSAALNRARGIIQSRAAETEAYGVQGLADRVNDQSIVTMGLAWYPHPNVVIKAEYEQHESATRLHRDIEGRRPSNNKVDQINVAVGFIF
ncbi:MAG: hypothetical protein K1X75_08880 [Leptospirales bacterium]|nr:hypothetical protein [Leptospirales bacterium]